MTPRTKEVISKLVVLPCFAVRSFLGLVVLVASLIFTLKMMDNTPNTKGRYHPRVTWEVTVKPYALSE